MDTHFYKQYIATQNTSDPVFFINTSIVRENASTFHQYFPGHILYAVKCNPHPDIIKSIIDSGINTFDCSSLREIQIVHDIDPDTDKYFMNPVKNRQEIIDAYYQYHVRNFVVDSVEETQKILSCIPAHDIRIFIRITTPKMNSFYHLSEKFGASFDELQKILKIIPKETKLALSFHVGSQCVDPDAWQTTFETIFAYLKESKIHIDHVNIGGGFPVDYMSHKQKFLEHDLEKICSFLNQKKEEMGLTFYCEPGRIMVANACEILVKILLRKNDEIFINDSIYHTLSEVKYTPIQYPILAVNNTDSKAPLLEYEINGQTCCSLDTLNDRVALPSDLKEGDFLIIKNIGAYSYILSSEFNGLGALLFYIYDHDEAH